MAVLKISCTRRRVSALPSLANIVYWSKLESEAVSPGCVMAFRSEEVMTLQSIIMSSKSKLS